MEMGYIILNRGLNLSEIEKILNSGDFDIIEKNIIVLKNILKDHYTLIFECLSIIYKKINNYKELDNILNKFGIIVIINDRRVYEMYRKKIVIVKLPTMINLINEKQIDIMDSLYNRWINFDKLYLENKLPNKLNHYKISGYDNHNINNNLYIIKLYLELAKKNINNRKKLKKTI